MESAEAKSVTEGVLAERKNEDIGHVEAEHDTTSVYKQSCWIDFIDDENIDACLEKLNELKIFLSKTQKERDMIKCSKERTVCVQNILHQDFISGSFTQFVEKALCMSSRFNVCTNTSDQLSPEGVCYLHYKNEGVAMQELEQLKKFKSALNCQLLKDMYCHGESETPAAQNNSEVGSSVPQPLKKKLNEFEECPSILITTCGLTAFKDPFTLFTTTISPDVTEKQLWELFNLASLIVFYSEPYVRLYVMFENEEKLQKNIQQLQGRTPCLPPFQITRIEHARQMFRKRSLSNVRKTRKPEQRNGTGGQDAVGGQAQAMNAQALRAPLVQQGGQLLKPDTGGEYWQQPASGNRPAQEVSQTTRQGSTEATVMGSQGATQASVSDTLSSDANQAGEQKLSKSKLKRLKRKKKMNEELSGGGVQPLNVQQPKRQQQQVAGPNMPTGSNIQAVPDVQAGLALLQTLTSLAQNMSGAVQMNQFAAPLAQPVAPQPQNTVAQPVASQPQKTNLNAKQRKRKKEALKRKLQQQQQQSPEVQQQSSEARIIQNLQNMSTNQGQYHGTNWTASQGQADSGTGSSKKKHKKQKKQHDYGPQASQFGSTFIGSSQDFVSFEDTDQYGPPVTSPESYNQADYSGAQGFRNDEYTSQYSLGGYSYDTQAYQH